MEMMEVSIKIKIILIKVQYHNRDCQVHIILVFQVTNKHKQNYKHREH